MLQLCYLYSTRVSRVVLCCTCVVSCVLVFSRVVLCYTRVVLCFLMLCRVATLDQNQHFSDKLIEGNQLLNSVFFFRSLVRWRQKELKPPFKY